MWHSITRILHLLIDAKVRIQGDIQVWTVQKDAYELQKGNLRDEKGAYKKRTPDGLPLIYYATGCNSDQQKIHHGPNSMIWKCKSKRVRKLPTSGKMSAKWCA